MADHPIDELALTALRYAAGDLPPPQAEEFEGRMAADQEAREALGEAIRLSAAALHQPVPAPDPLFRVAVREALRPTVISRLFPRRPYRGHPLAWAGLGAAVAVGLFVFGVELAGPAGEPESVQAPAAAVPTTPATSPEVLAVRPHSPASAASSPETVLPAAGSLANNLPAAHSGTTSGIVPGPAADARDMSAATPSGPAIAADPEAPGTGVAPPPRSHPKAGLPAPSPSPSLVMPGGDWSDWQP
jgi:hypothetical protein